MRKVDEEARHVHDFGKPEFFTDVQSASLYVLVSRFWSSNEMMKYMLAGDFYPLFEQTPDEFLAGIPDGSMHFTVHTSRGDFPLVILVNQKHEMFEDDVKEFLHTFMIQFSEHVLKPLGITLLSLEHSPRPSASVLGRTGIPVSLFRKKDSSIDDDLDLGSLDKIDEEIEKTKENEEKVITLYLNDSLLCEALESYSRRRLLRYGNEKIPEYDESYFMKEVRHQSNDDFCKEQYHRGGRYANRKLENTAIAIDAVYGWTTMKFSELSSLKNGDVIHVQTDPSGKVDVCLGGTCFAKGVIRDLRQEYALEITGMVQ